MPLVAYANSSDSESDEDIKDNAASKVTILKTNLTSAYTTAEPTQSEEVNENADLFTNLPQPKPADKNVVEEEQDEFLQKKEQPVEKPKKRQPVKIGIPSLQEFNEEDEPKEKKTKVAKSKSGLIALLPPPKVAPVKTTSFVPNVLQKKINKPVLKPQTETVSAKPPPPKPQNIEISDSDDDDDVIEIPDTFDDDTWEQVCGKQTKAKPKSLTKSAGSTLIDQNNLIPTIEPAPETSKPYKGLDNEAFKALVGSTNGRQTKQIVDVIEINEDDVHPDKQEWLKSLTDPNSEAAPAIKNPVNNTCRVKNHITSLAQKALANDKELQMRWAESRHNRMQTRSKYGF